MISEVLNEDLIQFQRGTKQNHSILLHHRNIHFNTNRICQMKTKFLLETTLGQVHLNNTLSCFITLPAFVQPIKLVLMCYGVFSLDQQMLLVNKINDNL